MAPDRPHHAARHPVWNDGQPILLGQFGRFVGLAEPQREAMVEGFVTGLEWWADRESTYWLGRITVERVISSSHHRGDIKRETTEATVFKEISSAERQTG